MVELLAPSLISGSSHDSTGSQGDGYNSAVPHSGDGPEEGTTQDQMGGKNDLDQNTNRGTGEQKSSTTSLEDDQALNLDQILERYRQHPTIRMKSEGTRGDVRQALREIRQAHGDRTIHKAPIVRGKGEAAHIESHCEPSAPLEKTRTFGPRKCLEVRDEHGVADHGCSY